MSDSISPSHGYGILAHLALGLIFLLGGCAGIQTVDSETRHGHQSTSNFQAIAQGYMKEGKPSYDKSNLLDALEAGKAFHDAGLWQESHEAFDIAAEKLAWKEDTVDTPDEVLNLIGTTLTSSAFGSYQGKIFEGGLLDYYQAVNAIMMGSESNARVDLNRFDVRMENAKTQFQAYRNALQKKSQENLQDPASQSADKSLASVSDATHEGLADMPALPADARVEISAGHFVSGIFRATSSSAQDKDPSKVVRPMISAGEAAASSSGALLANQMAETLQSNQCKAVNKVFVLYEDGTGPSFKEFRVDLPLFLVTDKVTYSGIALPKFVSGKPAFGQLLINGTTPTAPMTQITQLAALDFDVAYPGIVSKAVVSTVIKTAAQAAVNNQIDKKAGSSLFGSLLKLGVGAAQMALTQADTRVWGNLPDTIQWGVVDRPVDNMLHLAAPDGRGLVSVELPPGENTLVLVKATGVGGLPAVYVRSLPVPSDH